MGASVVVGVSVRCVEEAAWCHDLVDELVGGAASVLTIDIPSVVGPAISGMVLAVGNVAHEYVCGVVKRARCSSKCGDKETGAVNTSHRAVVAYSGSSEYQKCMHLVVTGLEHRGAKSISGHSRRYASQVDGHGAHGGSAHGVREVKGCVTIFLGVRAMGCYWKCCYTAKGLCCRRRHGGMLNRKTSDYCRLSDGFCWQLRCWQRCAGHSELLTRAQGSRRSSRSIRGLLLGSGSW